MKKQITVNSRRKFLSSTNAGNCKITESNTLPSDTVPDQGMSVREIISKYASGIMPGVSRELEYTEDLPDLRGMDISELHNYKREVREEIQLIEEELNSREEPPTPPTPTPPEPPKTEDL